VVNFGLNLERLGAIVLAIIFSATKKVRSRKSMGQLLLTGVNTCAVERRWSTAGESPVRELGSLHPEAIRAAVEETKPSEPLV
jgi:hypothetical protein